jgi:hypothetical protein
VLISLFDANPKRQRYAGPDYYLNPRAQCEQKKQLPAKESWEALDIPLNCHTPLSRYSGASL